MFFMIVLCCFVVLLFCYLIAVITRREYLKIEIVKNFLFGNNDTNLAIGSNIGSILCISIIIGTIFPAIIWGGLLPIICIIIGIRIGYTLLYRISKSLVKVGLLSTGYTLLGLVDEKSKSLFRAIQYLLYFISLVIEIMIFRFLLNTVLPESPMSVFIILFIILYLCATYISIGGYVGVLRTDIFQLFIFGIGVIYIFYTSFSEVVQKFHQQLFFVPQFNFSVIKLSVAAIIAAIIYNSAWPDLWIRNISTLQSNKDSTFKSIKFGSYGIIIVFGIIIFFSVMQITPDTIANKSFDTQYVLEILTSKFFNIADNSIVVWSVIGLVLCILLTTIDTWLIGFMQHSTLQKYHFTQLMPYVLVTCSLLLSYILSNYLFYIIALLNPLLLFSNFWILLLAFTTKKIGLNILKPLIIYLCISFLYTLLSFSSKQIFESGQKIVIVQFFMSLIILYVIPIIIDWISRRKKHDNK